MPSTTAAIPNTVRPASCPRRYRPVTKCRCTSRTASPTATSAMLPAPYRQVPTSVSMSTPTTRQTSTSSPFGPTTTSSSDRCSPTAGDCKHTRMCPPQSPRAADASRRLPMPTAYIVLPHTIAPRRWAWHTSTPTSIWHRSRRTPHRAMHIPA